MLKEYAVNPTVMGQSWLQFRYLLDSFGFERGRLMSKIPQNWETQVIQAAEEASIGDRDLARIIEKLQAAKLQKALLKQTVVYDDKKSWIDNALAHRPKNPLQAILNDDNVSGQEYVITTDDIDEDHPLWTITRDWEVPRSARELADGMKPLILAAKKIWIIDPYFNFTPGTGHFVETLTEILKDIAEAANPPIQFQIHYKTHPTRRTMEAMKEIVARRLAGIIPSGMRLELFEWDTGNNSDAFHDRHLLGDCGGLTIGHGFDAAGSHQKALFQLNSDEIIQTLKAKFSEETSPFRLAQPILSISSNGDTSLVSPKAFIAG